MKIPTWLPGIISVDGAWEEEVLPRLYGIFDKDFKRANRTLRGLPIWWDRRILEGDRYEEAFWYLITKKDRKTGDRLFDPRRAERLPWCGPIISNANDSAVKV